MKKITKRQLDIGSYVISYELERKAVKNINLRIRSNETIYVSANPHIPQNRIDAFLIDQRNFILRSLKQIRHYGQAHRQCVLVDGSAFCIAGKTVTLAVFPGKPSRMWIKNDILYMTAPADDSTSGLRLYRRFLAAEAAILFPQSLQRMHRLIAPYGVSMPAFHQRIMKSRWGSCMPYKQSLTLNTYLAVMPETCIDQVVLHELCHLIHPNHSTSFYALLTHLMPDWKTRRQSMEHYISYCI